MKIESRAFKSAIDTVMPYVVPNSPLAILACIKLEADSGSLKFTASCVDAQIEHTAPGSSDSFAMCVNAAALKQFAQFCTGEVSITLKGEKVHLKSGSMNARLSTLDAAHFPVMIKSEKIIAELEWKVLCERINFAALFTAKQDIRPFANCVHIKAMGDHIDVYGSDGGRMGFISLPHISPEFGISIHSLSVRRMTSDFTSLVIRDEQIELRNADSVALIKLANCKLIDGRRLIDSVLPSVGDLDRKSLIDAATFAASFHDEKLRCVVRISAGEQNILRLASRNNDAESPFTFTGDPFEVGAYASDLIEAMKALEGDTVRMEYNGAEMNNSPMRFTSGDKQILIMPLRT